jgi:hypothetical protein
LVSFTLLGPGHSTNASGLSIAERSAIMDRDRTNRTAMPNPALREISDYICGLTLTEAVRLHLTHSVGRILLKAASRGEDWRTSVKSVDLPHIVDWLEAAVINEESWLSNVDAQGRPKKLLKFSTLDDVAKEVDKSMLKAAQKGAGVKLKEGDESLFMNLEGGFRVVRLLTAEALDAESAMMQHCVGSGAYDHKVGTGGVIVLSLRDIHGKPHATLEVNAGTRTVVQLQGKQNAVPKEEYLTALIPLFREHSLRIGRLHRNSDLYLDASYNLVDIENLPDTIAFNADLDIEDRTFKMPKCLKVDGYFSITNSTVIGCSAELLVSRDFRLLGVRTQMPIAERLRVDGPTHVEYSGFTVLPSHSFGRSVTFTSSKVVGLENIVRVEGDYDLNRTRVETLPEGLAVTGSLNADHSQLKCLPKGLAVGKSLSVKNTRIRTLPYGFNVHGDLNVASTLITELPDGLVVLGDLDAHLCRIKRLPARLHLYGHVDLSGTELESLDDGSAFVSLDISNTPINALPQSLAVEGNLDARNCANLAEIGRNLQVGGSLDLERTSLKTLPEDMFIGCNLALEGASIKSLPDNLRVEGTLNLCNTAIAALPENLFVGNSLDLTDSAIQRVPSTTTIEGTIVCTATHTLAVDAGAHVGGGRESPYGGLEEPFDDPTDEPNGMVAA